MQEGGKGRKRKIENAFDVGSYDGTSSGDIEPSADGIATVIVKPVLIRLCQTSVLNSKLMLGTLYTCLGRRGLVFGEAVV